MSLTIGIDIGGTKVAAGVVDAQGKIIAQREAPTPSTSSPHVVDTVVEVIAALRGHGRIEAVGIGAAGLVDSDRSTVLFAPNLAWRNEPLGDLVAARIDLPVVVENDVNAMVWGEFRFGAGQGAADLVGLTVGTGIGGGLIAAGELRRGAHGLAAEFGHIRVVPNGRRCGCGNRGCLEQYCSGRALVREARDIALLAPTDAARMLELAGGDVEAITGQVVTEAGRDGDPAALECFAQIGMWLGQGLADLAAVLDPGRFVVGGGVIDAGELLLGPARKAYEAGLLARGMRPAADVLAATLGPQAGFIGAADLARIA